MMNKDLPANETLLPGTAPFSDHPGYDAESCPVREVVKAASYASNNGFRCYMTGGHCVPGAACESRRSKFAKEHVADSTMVVLMRFNDRAYHRARTLISFLTANDVVADLRDNGRGYDVLIRQLDMARMADLHPLMVEFLG